MKTLWILAKASLRHRWKMLLLNGITLGLVSFLACLSLLLFTSTGSPAKAMMEYSSAPDLYFLDSAQLRSAGKSVEFWKNQDEVDEVLRYPALMDLKHNPVFQGKPMENLFFLFSEAQPVGSDKDFMIPYEIEPPTSETLIHPAPGKGEIWIPQSLAASFEMKKGDSIEVYTARGLVSLRVSGIIIDPFFNSPFINPRRVWVSPGFLAENFPASRLKNFSMALFFKEGTTRETQNHLWKEYIADSGFSGLKLDKETSISVYGQLTNIIGAVLSILSVFALAGGLAVIASTINQSIHRDFKIIGILQTVGFSPKKVAGLFLIQLLPVYLIFSLLGTALAPLGLKLLVRSTLEATGTGNFSIAIAPLLAAGLGLTLLTALFTALFSALKAGKMRTADAIRFGEEVVDLQSVSSGKKLSTVLPLWASLGFRQARMGGKKALATALTLFFSVFAAYLCISSMGAMDSLSRKPNFFDFSDSDVYLKRAAIRFNISHQRLMADLQNDPEVERVLSTGYVMVTLPAVQEGIASETAAYIIEGDLEAAGIETIYGKNPSALLECAVNSKTAEEYALQPGSTLEVSIEGHQLILNVSGIYQSMNNMGRGLRLTPETILAINPVYEPVIYDIFLQEGSDIEAFIQDITFRLGEAVTARPTEEMVGEWVDSILSEMYKAIMLASLLFIIISSATMISATHFETRAHARSFALLSLVGLSKKDIQRVVACKMAAISLLASLAGIVLSAVCAPTVLLLIIKNMGMVKIPFFFHLPGALIILSATVLLSVGVSWLTSGRSLKTNIRQLVVE